jgi:hypothetical protein
VLHLHTHSSSTISVHLRFAELSVCLLNLPCVC